MPTAKQSSSNGMIIALCAFMLFPMGDAIVKSMSGAWPGPAVAAMRYVIGTAVLFLLIWRKYGRAGFLFPRPALQLARAGAACLTIGPFFAAVQLMPLVEVTAISFTSPMIVVLISTLVLKERAPRAAWLAIAVAFAGMLIILRPSFADIGWAGLLPLLSATGFALTITLNRLMVGEGSALQMQWPVTVLATPILLLAVAIGHASGMPRLTVTAPDWTIVARCAVIGITGTLGHYLLFMATERTSPTSVAPLTYVQLLVASTLGALFFHDWPDVTALFGAALIVGAGLTLWRARA